MIDPGVGTNLLVPIRRSWCVIAISSCRVQIIRHGWPCDGDRLVNRGICGGVDIVELVCERSFCVRGGAILIHPGEVVAFIAVHDPERKGVVEDAVCKVPLRL